MSLKGSKKRKKVLKNKDPEKRKKTNYSIISYFILFLILVYQKTLSPIFGKKCRFIPTCSNYSILAIKKYGLIRGLFKTLKRVCKCHPLNKGGYDPVP